MGTRVQDAVQVISKENTVVTLVDVVTQIPPNAPTCCNRIYLVVDSIPNGIITTLPKVG